MPSSATVSATAGRVDERFLNRELSWLAWNTRVLDLAADPSVPLLERVRFCAIASAALDDFFMVRVAGLMDQAAARVPVRSDDGRTPQEALAEIRERVLGIGARQAKVWKRDLRPALADAGIVVAQVDECEPAELEELDERFDRDIYPVLTPLAVGPGVPFPYISGLSSSLAVFVRDPESGEERFARVKVPELLPRFLAVGKRGLYLPLERVIRHYLARLFPKMDIVECCLFRVTRDADLEVSDEADDLLEAVQAELRRRRFGDVVRVEVAGSASRRMFDRLKRGLRVEDEQIYLVQGLLDLADLTEFADLDRPELKDDPWIPPPHPRLADSVTSDDYFDEIRRGDILVHHPYHSFRSTYHAFISTAATDPDVVALKTTVYRTSEDSPIVPALVEAAEEGKQAVCLVELKARFDERRNIRWSQALEQSGVHIVYGFPNMKVHAKMTLVVRREEDELRRYVHIGTGNYHARTARLYEDFGLFTSDEDITKDIADLFNYLTGFSRPRRFRKILVAPFDLRDRIIAEIRDVGRAAAAGKHARIRLKLNNLTDAAIIEELYAASQQGARVEIVCRSVCALRPGVEGLSDNIHVRSILGRFLEHSRVYVFEAGEESTYLLGSADLMPRNLDHRIEVVVPVEDGRLQQEIERTFGTLLADNATAWELRPDAAWARLRPKKGERSRPTQTLLLRALRARERRRGIPRRSA